MTSVNVGHIVNYTWEFVDASGNGPPAGATLPVATSATIADTPATPPVDTFTASAGPVSTTAALTATAPGSDTVVLTVMWTNAAGAAVTSTFTDLVTISAAPFVPVGVQLVAAVV